MASGPAMAGAGTRAGRPRSRGVDRHVGAGPAADAGATPAAVARLLALADGTGVEAVLAALSRLRAAGTAAGSA